MKFSTNAFFTGNRPLYLLILILICHYLTTENVFHKGERERERKRVRERESDVCVFMLGKRRFVNNLL